MGPVGAGATNLVNSPERAAPTLKDMENCGLDEGGSEDDDDEEGDPDEVQNKKNDGKKYEYLALNQFKDLYKHSPII